MDKICKNCKHAEIRKGSFEIKCQSYKFWRSYVLWDKKNKEPFDGIGVGLELLLTSNFGCIHFEEKERKND